MVLLSKSTDAGTSTTCPGKRHLRLFWASTEQPSHVVLTITVSVAISSGRIYFALSCSVQALAFSNTGMHGAWSSPHFAGGDWRDSGHRALGQVGSETILVLSLTEILSRRLVTTLPFSWTVLRVSCVVDAHTHGACKRAKATEDHTFCLRTQCRAFADGMRLAESFS